MSEHGIVKWYSLARGYGFIRREGAGEDDGEDIFVHHSEVSNAPLAEGERVSFEVVDSPKGLKARDVHRAPDEADDLDGAPAADDLDGAPPADDLDGAPPARRQ